jgi:hypothetical protein
VSENNSFWRRFVLKIDVVRKRDIKIKTRKIRIVKEFGSIKKKTNPKKSQLKKASRYFIVY